MLVLALEFSRGCVTPPGRSA